MNTSDLGRVRPIYRGPYSATTTYTPLDFISFNGNTYFCTLTSTGIEPTDTSHFQSIIDTSLLVTLAKFNAEMDKKTDKEIELLVGKGLSLDGAAGTEASPASGDLSASRFLRLTVLPETKASKRNRHLNPAFQVCQDRAAGATIAVSGSWTYVLDGTMACSIGGGVLTCSQAAKPTPGGSPNRLRAAVTTADAAIAAGDAYYIVAKIEGVDVADLKFGTAEAQPFVWRGIVNFPAGTYGLSFANATRNRSYVTTFTISAEQAGTDVLVTAVVPGCTDGVWLGSNSGVGINVSIALAMGTTGRTATTGAWVAGEYYTTAAQTNGMASTANVFELADIGLYAGTELPAWELPDYAAEVQRCRRYYERISIGSGTINAYAGTSGNNDTRHFPFKVPKRVTPSTSLAIEVYACTAAVTITTDLVRVTATATASGLYWWRHTAEYFVADARL